LALAF